MFKILYISLITLLICLNFADSEDKPNNKINLEAINAFAELGTSVSKAAVLQNTEAVVDIIGALGKAIPYLGPIATIISGILGLFIHHPDELAEIKKKLTEMDSHLFAIENKIDALSREIVHVAEINFYKEHADKINVIQDSYQRYVATPTDITRKNLVVDCERNKMLEYINYVYREISNEKLLPLMNVMKDDYNMKNFQFWVKILVSSTSQAMFLHSVCMGVQYPIETDLQKTMNGDIEHFKSISNTLSKVTQDGIKDIKNNFFNNAAKREIHEYAQAHQPESHESFSKNVFQMLSTKYFWRFWFVGSYSDRTSGFNQHCVAGDGMPWVHYWFRNLGRSLYISSTNNPVNFHQKLQDCLNLHHTEMQNKYLQGHLPSDIFAVTAQCLGSLNGLGVVHFGNDLRAYSHTNQDPFINVDFSVTVPRSGVLHSSYSVFAIAPELPHGNGIYIRINKIQFNTNFF